MAILDFTASTLTHADLSNCKFSGGVAFDGTSAANASFAGATLKNCSMGHGDFTGANFTGAQMAGVSLDYSDFTNAVMNQAMLTKAGNIAYAKFIGTKLQGADFSGNQNIYNTDFTGADLTGAVFTGSSVTGTMTIKGADLTGAALNNVSATKVTIYPKMIVFDSKTNFTRTQLQYIDFSGYDFSAMVLTQADLTGCKLIGATFINTELSYATLDNTKLTGTVQLNGANLSNASMMGADLTNAQLGALSDLFSVGSATSNYTPFLTALQNGDAAGVQTVFAANGYPITGVTIVPSRYSSTVWTVEATGPTPANYTVIQETVGGVLALDVYIPTTPAVLSNAYMVNVNLTGANMMGVNAAGASIYGTGGSKPNLNSALLQEAQFDNANLGNADFSSANLAGVSFDYALLTNSVFQNVTLTTAAGGARPSFVGANLQGANFDGATVSNTVFTNAALGVANPNIQLPTPAGVWLFSLNQQQQTLVVPELQAAVYNTGTPKHQFTLSLQSLQQLQVPGPVGAGIVNGFKTAGITLTDAILTITNEEIYWQLTSGSTHYVIFQSYDTANSRPALGVAAGTSYTPTPQFTLPLSLEGDLKNGPVDQAVIDAFATAGHPIQADSQILVAQHPTDWQIINGAPDYQVYSLWLDLSAGTTTITVRPAIPNLLAAFYTVSIALSPRATITSIASGGWMVSNDAEDPYNPVVNYITFNLIPNGVTGALDAYGSIMRIQRYQTPTISQYFNIPAAITNISQAQMSTAGNVCPNGDFASSNVTNGLPFNQWLRARVAPRPPLCVPDPSGMYYCPR